MCPPTERPRALLTTMMVMLAGLGAGCDDGGESEPPVERPEYRVAVLMNTAELLPELAWAAEAVATAGGVAGGDLVLEPIDLSAASTQAERLQALIVVAGRDDVHAAIGLTTSAELLQAVPLFEAAHKPVISFSATGSEVTRAFAGSTHVWRTKLSDLAQGAFLASEARAAAGRRVALITPADGAGETWFDWFAFLAGDAGFPEEAITIEVYGPERGCAEAMAAAVAARAEVYVTVPGAAEDVRCIVEGSAPLRGPQGGLLPTVLLAETGLELPPLLEALGPAAFGMQGWTSGPADRGGFAAAWEARFGQPRFPANAAAAWDAVLLVAYGLEASGGEPRALAAGIAQAVAGDGPTFGWADVDGALAAIRAGEAPALSGASGPLRYDVGGVDPTAGTLSHWVWGPEGATFDRAVTLGDDEDAAVARLGGQKAEAFRAPTSMGGFTPAGEATGVAALVVSTSAGWSNYRHQADALGVYQRLRAAGVDDAAILFVGADDLADDPENRLPGQVRNAVGGPDLRAGATYDQPLGDTPEAVLALAAEALPLDAATNLVIYLAGHGGQAGMPFGAATAEAGANSDEGLLTPEMLREALCALRAGGSVRRILVVIEACYAGVFGDAEFGGLEAGCADGPLEGVALLTAANTDESSLGAGYDAELGAWVTDEFTQAVGAALDAGGSLLDLVQGVYLAVPGSHVSLYNAEHFGGSLDGIEPEEFFPPADAR